MTGSQWLDIALYALAAAAAISGWINGAAASGFALLGVAIGATSGLLVAPHLVRELDSPVGRLAAGLAVIAVMVLIGQIAGVTIGRAARRYISGAGARVLDSTVGAVFQAAAMLLVAWLVAIPVAAQEGPGLGKAVRGSSVLAKIDDVAPEQMQRIPAAFTSVLGTTGFPDILGPFGTTPLQEVPPPDPVLAGSEVVAAVQPSVLKILGRAESCSRALEGSGFVASPGLVMTNAHVVAGTDSVRVVAGDRELDADVVVYDPGVDVAVLRVPGLQAPVLPFADRQGRSGDDAIVVGYPGNGPYRPDAARIRERVTLRGPDIYREATVEREVYILRGSVREGNSGGPLITPAGQVVGVVFGAAMDAADTGYALTVEQVLPQLERGVDSLEPVPTGSCVGAR
ncbi:MULTISPECIES: MarP family serine protease [unclassified Dietzia]|uniref:MarP family serine protease n=1 Tax=unclassified Dietzia TaxID=2617939 RepID=UPI0015F83F96|nr:MarP family serine protease [Dietzia sp. DQ12-76]MBB1024783.1 MarP family serine protease [Dietzia sp. DQ12-76]MBB1028283.1 MarP family serine protease [Dietzia sp. DQ11-38-2]